MTSLVDAWRDVIAGIDGASRAALVDALDGESALDVIKQRVLAEAAAELRDDVAGATSSRVRTGKLGQAVALIEAGAAKEVVLTKVSRRTYYRALRKCAKSASSCRVQCDAGHRDG